MNAKQIIGDQTKAALGESGLSWGLVQVGDTLIINGDWLGCQSGDEFQVTHKTDWQVIAVHAGKEFKLGNNGLRFFVARRG